jgi:hypothetical protein
MYSRWSSLPPNASTAAPGDDSGQSLIEVLQQLMCR